MFKPKYLGYAFLPVALAVLVLILFIAFSMRPALDDLGLVSLLKEKGYLGSVSYNYYNFNFRYVSLLIFNLLFSIADINLAFDYLIPIFHLCMLSVFIFSLAKLAIFAFEKVFSYSCSLFEGLISSIIFIGTLYFGTSQSIEIWTYFTVILYYLYPIIFTVAGFSLIVSSIKRNIIWTRSLLFLCFLFAGAGVENYSIGLLLFLVVIILSRLIKTGSWDIKNFLNNSFDQKITIAFASLLISALFVYFAPGTLNRPNIENQMVITNLAGEAMNRSTGEILFNLIFQKRSLFVLLFLFGWLAIGSSISNLKVTDQKVEFKKIIFWILIVLSIFLIVTLLISMLVFKGNIPLRAWFPLNFVATLFLVVMAVNIGFLYFKKFKILLNSLVLISLLPALVYFNFVQIPVMVNYARSYDSRIQKMKLNENKDPKKVLFLAPLLPSGLIVSSEISSDTSQYINKIMASAYGINFPISLQH